MIKLFTCKYSEVPHAGRGLTRWEVVQKWPQNVWIKRALLVVLIGIVTIVEVNLVGDTTIYSLEMANIRKELHDSIVHNHPPAGGWVERGASGAMNIRVVIPYLVEFLHDETGACVPRLYKAVDIICIWLYVITVFAYLRQQFTAWESALACLYYYAAILPLTFALHSIIRMIELVFWHNCSPIWCARARRFWEFSPVATVAVLIKFDAIVLPRLYFLGNATYQTWRKYLFQSSAIAIILFVIFEGLSLSLCGVRVRPDYGAQILRNFKMMIETAIFYPATLAFGLPTVLAILGYKSGDQFMRASVWFAGMIAVILVAASNFEEIRAEQMLIPLCWRR